MNYTKHADVRAQQRCIPPLIVDWLLDHGHRIPSQGAVRLVFDKRSRKAIAKEVGTTVIHQLSKYMNVEAVVDPVTDVVITVQWKH